MEMVELNLNTYYIYYPAFQLILWTSEGERERERDGERESYRAIWAIFGAKIEFLNEKCLTRNGIA